MTTTSAFEPRPLRFGMNHPVVLVRSDGAESSVTITNVSQTGFRMKAAEVPDAGERVLFRGELGDVPAEVRWAAGKDAGGIFLPPDHR